jgi:hypothetical protein
MPTAPDDCASFWTSCLDTAGSVVTGLPVSNGSKGGYSTGHWCSRLLPGLNSCKSARTSGSRNGPTRTTRRDPHSHGDEVQPGDATIHAQPKLRRSLLLRQSYHSSRLLHDKRRDSRRQLSLLVVRVGPFLDPLVRADLVQNEAQSSGAVGIATYLLYFKAQGGIFYWTLVLTAFAGSQFWTQPARSSLACPSPTVPPRGLRGHHRPCPWAHSTLSQRWSTR